MAMNKRMDMDNILNECLERVVFRGENQEEVLKSYPDCANELRPLLQTALAVRHAAAVAPREEFRARARYEFHQALAAQRNQKPGFLTGFVPRWAAALTIILAIILASGGTVAAASNSMPDSVLYPVKLATEQAQMTLTFSDEGKAELYAEQTDKRVDEIVYLANKGDSDRVVTLTQKLDDSADKLASMTEAAYGNQAATMMAASSEAPITRQAAPQSVPAGSVPPMLGAGAPESEKSAAGAGAVAPATVPAAPTAMPAASPQPQTGIMAAKQPETAAVTADNATEARESKESKLKEIITANAIKHPAKLRAALERVPEPARQDILRSIAKTAASYEKAIRSIEKDER